MTPEGRVEKYLVEQVEAHGGRFRKLKWISRNGAPDRLIWWPFSPLFFVELKAFGKKPTAQQSREHKRLRADGFHVFVIDRPEGVDAFIKEAYRLGRA